MDENNINSSDLALKYAKQKELLENQYKFPTDYLFKFIVPKDKEKDVRALFPQTEPQTRPQNKGIM